MCRRTADDMDLSVDLSMDSRMHVAAVSARARPLASRARKKSSRSPQEAREKPAS